jgi:hypothetical protein
MRNPLESEEAAFRFVLGTIVYLAPIVVAAWIATWLGVIVFVAMSVLVVVVVRRGTKAPPPVVATERAAVEDTRRILVVTDTVPIGPKLREAILLHVAGVADDVLLICAVEASPASREADDRSTPHSSAQLDAALQELRTAGVNARGSLAGGDVLGVLEDALRRFDADEIVITAPNARRAPSVEPVRPSADDVAAAVRSHFAGKVTVISDDG